MQTNIESALETTGFGDTSSLDAFLRQLFTDILVILLDDFAAKYYTDIDDIIVNIVCSELDAPEILKTEKQMEIWRQCFYKSVMNELRIRYGAIGTAEKHSNIIGYKEMQYAVKDEEKLKELDEDYGRIFGV